MEGKLVKNILKELLIEIEASAELQNDVASMLETFEETVDGLGFCLSTASDLLSQWRGYADDAAGFSIGFNRDYFQHLCDAFDPYKGEAGFKIKDVAYTKSDQKKIVLPIIEEIKLGIEKGELSKPNTMMAFLGGYGIQTNQETVPDAIKLYNQNLRKKLWGVLACMFELKHEAFKEEQEVRLVSLLIKVAEDNAHYMVSRGKIIPFREIPLDSGPVNSILEVKLGPRNQTPEFVVRGLLDSHGFKDTKITSSIATYR